MSEGKATRFDWLIAAVIAVLLLAFAVSASAQDTWRKIPENLSLLPGVEDSLVVGPLSEFREFGVRRAMKNQDYRECAWEVGRRAMEIAMLTTESARKDARILELTQGRAQDTDLIESLNTRANKAEKRANRRKPWVYIAAGVIGGFIINNQTR